jgi:NAD(P)-dependent dehydrogenase (short-subunit alcohol dehydrogenase family)
MMNSKIVVVTGTGAGIGAACPRSSIAAVRRSFQSRAAKESSPTSPPDPARTLQGRLFG